MQGHASLNILRQELQKVFRTLGNVHWGDVTDARMLSEALDVGFCIFPDNVQANGSRCLVSMDGDRGNFKYFIAIWWKDSTHFRSMEIQCTPNDVFRTCWSANELPQAIVDLYNTSNKSAPVNSQTRSTSGIIWKDFFNSVLITVWHVVWFCGTLSPHCFALALIFFKFGAFHT